jgi:hypothetical protein
VACALISAAHAPFPVGLVLLDQLEVVKVDIVRSTGTTRTRSDTRQPGSLRTLAGGFSLGWGTYVSLIDSAHMSSDLPSKIEIVGDGARWTAVCRDQLPPLGDPFLEG